MGVALEKILIIGGGLGGLAAAHALTQQGYSVEVFEQSRELRASGAGLILSINAMRILADLGLAEHVARRGHALNAFGIADPTGRILSLIELAPLQAELGLQPLAIHRAALQEVLSERVPSLCLHFGRRLVEIADDGSRIQAQFSDGSTATGSLLVGCDGLHSKVRQLVHGVSELRYSGQTCWRGVCAAPPELLHACPAQQFIESWGAGRRFGYVHIGDGRVYWYATLSQPEQPALKACDQATKLLALFAGWHAPIAALVLSTPQSEVLQHNLYDMAPRRAPWCAGRVTLLGDAIHPSTPNLGQGAGMALESAAVLARALAQRDTLAGALACYEELRKPRTRAITEESWTIGKVSSFQGSMARFVRDTLMRLIPDSAALRRARATVEFNPYGDLAAR